MSIKYLDLGDFLGIAELVLDVGAEDIAHVSRLELAESALHARRLSSVGWSSIRISLPRLLSCAFG